MPTNAKKTQVSNKKRNLKELVDHQQVEVKKSASNKRSAPSRERQRSLSKGKQPNGKNSNSDAPAKKADAPSQKGQ